MKLVRYLPILVKQMASISIGTSFSGETTYVGEKLIYPAANRNKDPILDILKLVIPVSHTEPRLFLEISSGSGQHLSHFAPHFPHIIFQPSECDTDLFASISIYASNCPTHNMKLPLFVDITHDLSDYDFKEDSIDFIFNANMMHIAPYDCTIGLFKNAGKYLKSNGLLITYGPYGKDGVISPQSNIDFNISLKSRNPSWGIRDVTQLRKLAGTNGISLIETCEMPANNKCLIWKKV